MHPVSSIRITKRTVDAIAPRDRDALYMDEKLSGFGLKVTPSGKKVFIYQYRYPAGRGGRSRRYTIGPYSDGLTPDQARTIAVQLQGRVASGEDPAAARVAERREASSAFRSKAHVTTVGEVIDGYIAYITPRNRRWRDYDGMLRRHVRPRWGETPIYMLKRGDVIALLDEVEAAVSRTTADYVLRVVRAMFNWLAVRDEDFVSPIIKGMSRIRPSEHARDRILSDYELARVWRYARGRGYPFGPALLLLIMTGQRREDISQMQWSEIEGRTWTIPKERYKNKRAHTVPLTPLAMAILRCVPKLGPYVFTTTGKTPISGWSKVKADMDRKTGAHGWVLHDLRRTARSLMSRAGVRPDIAERVLGHPIPGVAGVYDRHHYNPEKRGALSDLRRELRHIVKTGF
jgi:integrase